MSRRWFGLVVALLVSCLLTFDARAAVSLSFCPSGVTYTISPGDTLTSIGARFGVSIEGLVAANYISDPDWIWAGKKLCIPVRAQSEFARVAFPRFADEECSVCGVEVVSVHATNWVCDVNGCEWEKNDWGVWVLSTWSRAFFSHRNAFPGSRFPELVEGDDILLYRTWDFSDETRLEVTGIEVLGSDRVDVTQAVWDVLEMTSDGKFAFITCHPAGDDSAPERLVIWAEAVEVAEN